MRYFQGIKEAAREIRRDLFKAPVVRSQSVQNIDLSEREVTAHEALNYSYTMAPGTIDQNPIIFLEALRDTGLFPQLLRTEYLAALSNWMSAELGFRLYPLNTSVNYSNQADTFHPELFTLKEGGAFSYSYPQRTIGMVQSMARVLATDNTSRRAFWPIFQQLDGIRASDLTRIPCTIGYQAIIRASGDDRFLHFTSLMRSMDFNRFWMTDLWMAAMVQREIRHYLPPEIKLGGVSQTILSFHFFNEGEEEIY